MTPVQLPEVPARSGTVTAKIKPGVYRTSNAYTADQLRAYATEAIRLHCERIARKIRARADEPGTAQHHGNQYVYGLRSAANTVDSLTPSETNSDR